MESLNNIRAFTKVVEIGTFTGAAKALGQTKSAVSKNVAHLEEHLGARLLNRTTRAVSPTEVGQAFFDRCQRILVDLENAERSVADLHTNPRGTLRINAPTSFGNRYLADAIADFMKIHTDLKVELDLNDRVVDLVDEGYDMAVRITSLVDSSLIARKIAPFRSVICASPSYWKEHGKPNRPEDLSKYNALIYSYLANDNEWSLIGPNGKTTVKISGSFKSNNGEALVSAGCTGLGILAVPTFIGFDALKAGLLEPVLTDYSSPIAGIYVVYPHNRHLSAKVRLFVDFLVARYSPAAPWDALC